MCHVLTKSCVYFTVVEMPPELEVPPRGKDSVEIKVQEEREQTALGAVYMGGQIQESAAEPSLQIPEEQVDAEVKTMLTGPDVDTIFWSGGVPAALELPPSSASVAELVGQLAAGSTDVPMGNVGQSFNFEPGILANIGPEQLQQLVQQAQAIQQSSSISYPASQSITQTPRGNGDQDWNSNPYPDYDRTYPEENGRERRWSGDDSWTDRGGSRGRGRGKGRGRGDGFGRGGFGSNKRKPCNFYAQGRRASLPCDELDCQLISVYFSTTDANMGINAISVMKWALLINLHACTCVLCYHIAFSQPG